MGTDSRIHEEGRHADVELAYYTRMVTAAAAAGHESSIFFSTFFARDFSPDIICQRVASSSPSNSASVVEAFAKRNSAHKRGQLILQFKRR